MLKQFKKRTPQHTIPELTAGLSIGSSKVVTKW